MAAASSPSWPVQRGEACHSVLPKRPVIQYVECEDSVGVHKLAYCHYKSRFAEPPKIPVVCGHGLTRNSYDFHWIAGRLAEGGHDVVCFDTAGRGASEPLGNHADYGYPQYVRDVLKLLATLGWNKIHWIGTSMGGLQGMVVATMAAHGVSVGALVLNDVGPFVSAAAFARIVSYVGKALPDPGYLDGLDEAVTYIKSKFPGMLPVPSEERWRQTAAYLTRPITSAPEEGGLCALVSEDADDAAPRVPAYDSRVGEAFPPVESVGDIDMWALWGGVQANRVLVLRGGESDILSEEVAGRMVAESPKGVSHGVRLVTYDGIGHAPSLWDDAMEKEVLDTIEAATE
jgi:pimeloyl-ACP methyl ester carboxylesterase